jgi:hypothetical protein
MILMMLTNLLLLERIASWSIHIPLFASFANKDGIPTSVDADPKFFEEEEEEELDSTDLGRGAW